MDDPTKRTPDDAAEDDPSSAEPQAALQDEAELQPVAETEPEAAREAAPSDAEPSDAESSDGAADDPSPEAGADPNPSPSEDAGEEPSMMELLLQEGDYLPERHHRGDVIEGVVVAREGGQLVINIGAKQEGIVPAADLARLPKERVDAISVGDTVRAIVMRPEGRDNEIVVSIAQALELADWDRAKALLDSGEVQELEIVGYNKGGALVGFGHLQGFLPRSHMVRGGERGSAEHLAEFVGQRRPIKIIEVNRRKRRLVMSEREAMREWRADRKAALMAELSVGDVRKGTVNALSDFGAFVDLGGADGLIHVSELSHDRTRHPRDVVAIGQEVEVVVLDVDPDRNRIGLSMKRLQKDPWETVEQDHYVGELVDATIANLADFGAFAKLDDGLEGLVHISELSDGHIDHPREAVRPGQVVTVEIISVDAARRRIGLSIRRVPDHLRRTDDVAALGDEAQEPAEDTEDAAGAVTASGAGRPDEAADDEAAADAAEVDAAETSDADEDAADEDAADADAADASDADASDADASDADEDAADAADASDAGAEAADPDDASDDRG